jgi:predicted unusual protein kinase regulating ubiquinone biosynthesis (AarF/ABC1/UbiB family)
MEFIDGTLMTKIAELKQRGFNLKKISSILS